jgi:hypothetical protein
MRAPQHDAPNTLTLAAVAFVTCGMLVFEILQTITLSLQVFAQNAFVVVSVAMLGLGCGGSLVTVFSTRGKLRNTPRVLWWCATLFAGSLVVTNLAASRSQALEALVLLGVVPYIFVGLFLAVLFTAWRQAVPRSYCADLIGSAAGCIAIVLLMRLTGSVGKVTLLAAAAAFVAAALLGLSISFARSLVSLVLAAATLMLLPFDASLYTYNPSPHKTYSLLLADPLIQTEREWSYWDYLGRLDVVRPGPGIERFVFGGEARAVLDRGGDYRFLFASGDNWSYAIRFADAVHAEDFRRTRIAAAPYRAGGPRSDVLVIGTGGGVDIFMAVAHNARAITAVDINPTMVRAARALGATWWNGAVQDPRVQFVEMDGRTFVETTRDRYDVITLTAVDTGAGVARGGLVLSENYLYTSEAWERYLAVLKPGGVIFVLRPTQDLVKLAVTVAGVLDRSGAARPQDHFVVLGGEEWRGMLVFRDPVGPGLVQLIDDQLRGGLAGGVACYLPGRTGALPEFQILFSAIAAGDLDALVKAAPAVRATYDDWPFFYHRAASLMGSQAGAVLARILAVVGIAGVLLVGAPLIGLPNPGGARRLPALAYFVGIGVGFMFAEIALIQKLALLLGHPAYSLTVTLFVLLLATGVGSMASGRLAPHRSEWLNRAPLAAAVLLSLIAMTLPWLIRLTVVPSLAMRVALASALLTPLGLVLGFAFPAGVRAVSQSTPALIPWAWAANAIASVLGAVLAVAVAMVGGFSLVLALAAAAYLLAFLSLNRVPETGAPRGHEAGSPASSTR